MLAGATPASVTAPAPDSRRARGPDRAEAARRTDSAAADRPVRPRRAAAAAAAEPGRRRAGAQPAGRRRCAGFRCAAARCRRAGRVRDVGDRHRQVAGRHLQRAAEAGRRRRRQDGASGCPSARRVRSPRTTCEAAATIEELATTVREFLEAGQIDGFVRTIRARPEGSTKPPVFVFHAAGGSTVVYEPLLNRLPADTPMYGFERVEGSIEERAARVRAEAARTAGRRAVHPGRLVAGRGAGLRLRDRAQAAGLRRPVRRADRRGDARASRSCRPRKRPASAGIATRGSPSGPSTSRSPKSLTSTSKSSTTRGRSSSSSR